MSLPTETPSWILRYEGRLRVAIEDSLNSPEFRRALDLLIHVRTLRGPLYIVGLGGSAANASHARNDFSKIAGMDAIAPLDNVAEWSAWINDNGWDDSIVNMLKWDRQRLASGALLALSVGGGSETTSQPLVQAAQFVKDVGGSVLSIVSRGGGMLAEISDAAVILPCDDAELITPVAESMQGVIWHAWANLLAKADGAMTSGVC